MMEFLSPQILDLIALSAAIGALIASVVAFQRLKRRQMLEAARVVAGGGEVEIPKSVLRVLVSPLAQSMRLLAQRTGERQGAVARGLPTAVDLLVTCLDAGLSLEQAVARVAKDLAHSEPIFAEELKLTASEFE